MNEFYPAISIVLKEYVDVICEYLEKIQKKQNEDDDDYKDRQAKAQELKTALSNTDPKTRINNYEDYLDELQKARDFLVGPDGEFENYTNYATSTNDAEIAFYKAGNAIEKAYKAIELDILNTHGLLEEERASQYLRYMGSHSVTLDEDEERKKFSEYDNKPLVKGEKLKLPLFHRPTSEKGEEGLSYVDKKLSGREKSLLIAGGIFTAGFVPALYGAYKGIRLARIKANDAVRQVEGAEDVSMGDFAMHVNCIVGDNNRSVSILQYNELISKIPGQSAVLKSQALDWLLDLAVAKGLKPPYSIPEFDANKFKLEGGFQDQMWSLLQKGAKRGITFSEHIMKCLTREQYERLEKLRDDFAKNNSEPDLKGGLAKKTPTPPVSIKPENLPANDPSLTITKK